MTKEEYDSIPLWNANNKEQIHNLEFKNMFKNIAKESKYKLNEVALFEFEEYFHKAVKYKDFNFIIVPINDKYQYTAEQYLALLENYHNHLQTLERGLKIFKQNKKHE